MSNPNPNASKGVGAAFAGYQPGQKQKRPGGDVGVRPADLQDLRDILQNSEDQICDLNDFSCVNDLTDEEIKTLIERSPYYGTREQIAENLGRFPDTVIKLLLRDRSEKVRTAVARNPFAPSSAIETLASDSVEEVATAACSNKAASVQTHVAFFRKHIGDDAPNNILGRKLWRLAEHPDLISSSIGPWLIEEACKQKPNPKYEYGYDIELLRHLSRNAKLPEDTYRQLFDALDRIAGSPARNRDTWRDAYESDLKRAFEALSENLSVPEAVRSAAYDRLRPQNSCFPPDAVVSTPDGPRKIEDIAVGDVVYSVGFRSRLVERPVTRVFRHPGAPIMRLTAGPRVLRATRNHRVLTRRGWREIGCLSALDEVKFGDTYFRIDSITTDGWVDAVYNLHTAFEHNCLVDEAVVSNFTRVPFLQHLFSALFVDLPLLAADGARRIAQGFRPPQIHLRQSSAFRGHFNPGC